MNKVNTLSKLVLVFGLATAMLGAGSVLAKNHEHRHTHQSSTHFLLSKKGANELALTNKQQAKINAIFNAQKAQMKALKRTNKDNRKTLHREYKVNKEILLSATTFDENLAKELLAHRLNRAEKIGLIKLKTEHHIWQVLNAEQREKLTKTQKNKYNR